MRRLIKDGHDWQNININGLEEKSRFYFSFLQYLFIIIAIGSLFINKEGFNIDFIGYIITALSLFVGLFMTLILTVYDKFREIDFDRKNKTERQKFSLIQKKNFFKQFTALTSYSILISITCILLLSLSLLTNYFNVNVFQYEFITNVDNITWESFLKFIVLSVIILQRVFIIYFFLDFLLMVVYALTSIYHYISIEFDSKKIN